MASFGQCYSLKHVCMDPALPKYVQRENIKYILPMIVVIYNLTL